MFVQNAKYSLLTSDRDSVRCGRACDSCTSYRGMDEGRKRVLLIAAAILASRKLAQFDRVQMVPASMRKLWVVGSI